MRVGDGDGLCIETMEELFALAPDNWQGIKRTFAQDFRAFDRLLHRLHYKRNKPFAPPQRHAILRFLTTGYLLSNDVRYLNEFLWFDSAPNADGDAFGATMMDANLLHFRSCITGRAFHTFPLATRCEVEHHISTLATIANEATARTKNLKVLLLGPPYRMQELYRILKQDGYATQIGFVNNHPRKLQNLLYSNGALFKLFSLLRGGTAHCSMINKPHNDPALSGLLEKFGADIAVHRLSFILKSNIIRSFRLGVLNDHLAVLPYIRGMSSVEYSILFGFPVGATIHVVDEGVDTGAILAIRTYPLDASDFRTSRQVKRYLQKQSARRLQETLHYIAHHDYQLFDNPVASGLQYYSMHPDLTCFVDEASLPCYASPTE